MILQSRHENEARAVCDQRGRTCRMGPLRVRGGTGQRAGRHRTTTSQTHRRRAADDALSSRLDRHAGGRCECPDCARAAVDRRMYLACVTRDGERPGAEACRRRSRDPRASVCGGSPEPLPPCGSRISCNAPRTECCISWPCAARRVIAASRYISAVAARRPHGRRRGSRCALTTWNRSSMTLAARRVRHGPRSTGGHTPPASRRWPRMCVVASGFRCGNARPVVLESLSRAG